MTSLSLFTEDDCFSLVRLRLFQHQINELLKNKANFSVPIHLGFGHEALAVAIASHVTNEDAICLSHRNSVYNLALSGSLLPVLDHYHLRSTQYNGVQMGSMNLALQNTPIRYSSSILGNNLALSCGIAINKKIKSSPGTVFAFTGDGAIEEGVFWESLIFAQTHNLRIIFVLENNNCSMSSSISERRCHIDLDTLCSSLGMSYQSVDGAYLPDVKNSLITASESLNTGICSLIEFNLKTFCQHAGPTPGWPDDPLSISLEDGLTLKNDPADPLVFLRDSIGIDKFNLIAQRVFSQYSSI